MFVGGEVVPVGTVGGEFGVDAFFEDVAVEEDCFFGLFLLERGVNEKMGVGERNSRLCIASVRIPKDSGYPGL